MTAMSGTSATGAASGANVRVRKASAADASAIAHVYVRSWRATYPGILPGPVLRNMNETRETLAWWRSLCRADAHEATFVAQAPGGPVVGFASVGPERGGARRRRAELYTLYVLQPHQRRGLGTALLAACAGQLLVMGAESLVVWVLARNPARTFYEALGGARHGAKTIRVGGRPVREIGYLWPDLEALVAVTGR